MSDASKSFSSEKQGQTASKSESKNDLPTPRPGWRIVQRVLPYLWPSEKTSVKIRVILTLIVIVVIKLIAVGTPFVYRAAVDTLADEVVSPSVLLAFGLSGIVFAYGISRIFGIIFQEARELIFAPVSQGALRKLALETIRHVHRLSLRYHISRQTGALNRILERGIKGVSYLLRFMLFNIGPLIFELLLVSIILVTIFDFLYLIIIGTTVGVYITFTAIVTEWRVKIRRTMIEQDTDANQKAVDALLNFETVKYFGAEEREAMRYDQSMANYEAASIKTIRSLSILNVGQSLIVNAGLIASLLLAGSQVLDGRMTVGGFVMVNTYIMQVIAPLNFLGYVYREIRQALVDMTEMFALLEQPTEVADRPHASELQISEGKISFEHVVFGYDESREIIKDISFSVEGGKTVALVGASGSGKSTIGRLLFRFYDVVSGQILIDEQDIRDVTQQSLHQAIGVVPQDTVLFNETVGYNIAYGRPNATQAEIEEVAKAADIHDFIASLPEGYQTTVGERGLKLSGGEKQRIGIARTLLKNPPILLLDEATSALDTKTEENIQQCLNEIGKQRTVMIITHRLSTVVDADQIIVLENGEIIEQGTHHELLENDGRYAELWNRQANSVR